MNKSPLDDRDGLAPYIIGVPGADGRMKMLVGLPDRLVKHLVASRTGYIQQIDPVLGIPSDLILVTAADRVKARELLLTMIGAPPNPPSGIIK